MLYPLRFKSVYKDYVWGGNLFREVYGREIPCEHTAESWDVACHNNGMGVVLDGELAGKTLLEIFNDYKEELLGNGFEKYDKFPLLIKLIDAKQRLSLQVHPEDAYALVNEDGELGKCEMWYVLRAEEGAKLTIGLKDGVTKEEFRKGIENGNLEDYINEIPVKAGDVIDIPAGLLHAIEEGIMIAEVQQNSDTVYRVYDWGRMGNDGKPRQLHVDKALEVIDFDQKLNKEKQNGIATMVGDTKVTDYIYNQYFGIEEIVLKGAYEDSTEKDHMVILMCLTGTMDVVWNGTKTSLKAGETVLMPAVLGDYNLVGDATILKAYLPTEKTDVLR